MKTFAIHYRPIWGQFTRYIAYVKAMSYEHAEVKFYGTKDADNCQCILIIEDCGVRI